MLVCQVPCGVAVSGREDDGRIYVADYNNRRVVRLTRNARYDGCYVAAANSATRLVQPQALDFSPDGRLVVADRTHVKIFDVGVRTSPPSDTAATEPSENVTEAARSLDDEAAASDETKARPARTAGQKPAVPPRPKYLKELTFVGGEHAHRAKRKSARSQSASPSLSPPVTSTTSPLSTAFRTSTAARHPSTTSVTSSHVETEVW